MYESYINKIEDAGNYLLHLQGKGDKASTLNNNNGSLVFFYNRVLDVVQVCTLQISLPNTLL